MGVTESTLDGASDGATGIQNQPGDSSKEQGGKALPPLPTHFTDRSAFESAAKAVDRKIQNQGLISAADALKTLVHFQKLSETVIHHFPGAQDGKYVTEDLMKTLDMIGVTRKNTIFAQSICPDEINHRPTDINKLISSHFGKVFHLGGLAGIPFTGKTGIMLDSGLFFISPGKYL